MNCYWFDLRHPRRSFNIHRLSRAVECNDQIIKCPISSHTRDKWHCGDIQRVAAIGWRTDRQKEKDRERDISKDAAV